MDRLELRHTWLIILWHHSVDRTLLLFRIQIAAQLQLSAFFKHSHQEQAYRFSVQYHRNHCLQIRLVSNLLAFNRRAHLAYTQIIYWHFCCLWLSCRCNCPCKSRLSLSATHFWRVLYRCYRKRWSRIIEPGSALPPLVSTNSRTPNQPLSIYFIISLALTLSTFTTVTHTHIYIYVYIYMQTLAHHSRRQKR